MTSHTVQSSRDWLRTPRTNFLAWWIPQASILAGLLVPVPIRGAVWSVLHAEHSSKGVQMLAITIESGTLDKIKP
ncbi:MAG TPA: hypothetical protein VNU68_23115, partial [Verrucomicrobiae bacterium]|nr:hypothetical protein [Verrucomicrobiae bacterium]